MRPVYTLILNLALAIGCQRPVNDDSGMQLNPINARSVDCDSAHGITKLNIAADITGEWDSVTAIMTRSDIFSDIYIDLAPDSDSNTYSATIAILNLECDMPVITEYWLYNGTKYYIFR